MRRRIVIGLVVLLGIGVAMAWAQVYPVTWNDPESLIPAVGPGTVALGDGALGMNPDTTFDTLGFGPTANVVLIQGDNTSVPVAERCTEQNRGEIRLKVLDYEVATLIHEQVDSLCLCAKKRTFEAGVFDTTTYHWACFNSANN